MRTAQEVCDEVNEGREFFTLKEIVNLVEDRDHWKKRAKKAEKIQREKRNSIILGGERRLI